MTEESKQLFGVDFEVHGCFEDTQGYVNKRFIQSTGEFMTMTGWLDDSEKGCLRGYMEGERVYIDGVKFLIHEDNHSVAFIDKTLFGELRPIEKREYKEFQFNNNIVTPEIEEFFTPRKPWEMLVDPRQFPAGNEYNKPAPGFI